MIYPSQCSIPRLIPLFCSNDARWYPLLGPDEEHEGKAPIEVDSEEDFLGEYLQYVYCVCVHTRYCTVRVWHTGLSVEYPAQARALYPAIAWYRSALIPHPPDYFFLKNTTDYYTSLSFALFPIPRLSSPPFPSLHLPYLTLPYLTLPYFT
jgi:hypothetical protein